MPQRVERTVGNVLLCLDRGGVLTIEQIEELEQRLHLKTLGDVEPLGNAHVEIDVSWTGESIASSSGAMVDAVECAIAVGILEGQCLAAKMKTALRPENAANLQLPPKLQQSAKLKGVVD